MRKTKLFSLVAAALLTTTTAWADVAVNGKLPCAFSVSATKKVWFSQGNLQYKYNVGGDTWQFAANQWDYFGEAPHYSNEYEDECYDLLGWGTGSTPYNYLLLDDDYSTFTDWGTNAITNGGNVANSWRTLTEEEWTYLFYVRTTTSGIYFAKATVNGVAGIILLPDNWSASYYAFTSTNTAGVEYTSNTISATDWTNSLETHGAVFLPAAGYRRNLDTYEVGSAGFYWSSTPCDAPTGYCLVFGGWLNSYADEERCVGMSVRLVSETAPMATVTPPSAKSLTYNGSSQALINAGSASGGTIQYKLLGNDSWGTSIPTATNAGIYMVYYRVVADNSHTDNPGSTVLVTINRAALTCRADNKSVDYNSNPPTYTATYSGWKGSDNTSALSGTLSFDCSYAKGSNAGSYTITPFFFVTASNYTITYQTGTLTVNKINPTVTAPAAKSLTYNGSEQALVNAGSTTGGTLQYKLGSGSYSTTIPTGTNAGSYTVYYKIVGDGNYNDVAEVSFSVSINKADAVITDTPEAIEGLVYTGAAQTLVNAGSATGGELQYKLDDGVYGTSLPQATDAGTYTIYYKVIGDANHNNVAETSFAVTIGGPTSLVLTANQDPQHPSDYYSTFYHSAIKYAIPAGTEAYVAARSGDALNLTKIAEGGQVIPAANAVILKANSSSITLTPSDATAVSVDANDLKGTDAAISNPSYGHTYVLSAADGEVGFYKLSSGATIPAHKAYITITGSLDAPRRLRFVFDSTTDIENPTTNDERLTTNKFLRNGQLIIIRGDKEFNAQGQMIK